MPQRETANNLPAAHVDDVHVVAFGSFDRQVPDIGVLEDRVQPLMRGAMQRDIHLRTRHVVDAHALVDGVMRQLVQAGVSVLMISSELPEVLGMSDRVYVVSAGRIAGEMPIEQATQENIMAMATTY